MREFARVGGGRSVLVCVDGLINLYESVVVTSEAVDALCASGVDGIVMVASTAELHKNLFQGERSPALLVSVNWPSSKSDESVMRNIVSGEVEKALGLGASAVVSSFLVGHERDEDEARNFAFLGSLIDECEDHAIPSLIVTAPMGDRPTKETYEDCVGLAARMASEAGATYVAIPYAGTAEAANGIVEVTGVPTYLMDLNRRIAKGQPDCNLEGLLSAAIGTDLCGVALSPSRSLDEVKAALIGLHGGHAT